MAVAGPLAFQALQELLILTSSATLGTLSAGGAVAGGGAAAVGGGAAAVGGGAAVAGGAAVVAEVLVAPTAAYTAELLLGLGLGLGVGGVAILGGTVVAGSIAYLVDKFKSKNEGRKCPAKVEHEIDAFSSDSVEITFKCLSDNLRQSLGLLDDKMDKKDDEQKEEDKKCVMTENAIDTDNNMSDDEESAPRDSEKIRKIVLTRKSRLRDGTLTGSYHLVRRLTRFLRVAGMVEFGEDVFKIPKLQVFQPGYSQTKDQVCKIHGHHASHVVRLQIAPAAATAGPFYVTLRKFLGHTHCVHRVFNVRIGREIDTLQGNMLPQLLSIDWKKENPNNLSDAAANVLNNIRNAWLGLLRKAIESPYYFSEQKKDMNKAYSFIQAMSLKFLYSKTRVGIDYMLEADKIAREIGEKMKTFLQKER